MAEPIEFKAVRDLRFARERVWKVFRKTDWLNRSLGLPPVRYETKSQPEGGSEVRACARLAGLNVAWREYPFEWLEPEFYSVRRVFERGPFAEACFKFHFHELPAGSTRVEALSSVTPRNATGRILAATLLRAKAESQMLGILEHIDQFLSGNQPDAFPRLSRHPANQGALHEGLRKLREAGVESSFVRQIENLLANSADVELTHIRPLELATRWKCDSWQTLTAFLHATRCGLVDFRWEVLCPNCRSSRLPPARSLGSLKRTSHCEVCRIEFDGEFDKSVELSFSVNEAIRPCMDQTYCLAGPGGTPHVLSQVRLEPQEERQWKLPHLSRPVRVRSLQASRAAVLDPSAGAQGIPLEIVVRPSGVEISGHFRENAGARLRNPNAFPIVVSLDEITWSDDVLTAARVTNLQEFRDLFSSEVLSIDEEITVGSQVILFTDLRGSTAMYHGIGDAPAYALVRDHFSVITSAVSGHHGAIVKTIGDAVMACFSRVRDALLAVREMHENLHRLKASLVLKASLHAGPCLAVNANEKLDYFGTSVNLAARMVSCCQGGDLAVSDSLFQNAEVEDFLAPYRERAEPSEVSFRGFSEPQRVWRIPII